jgi:chromosome partitioning protein
MHRIYCIANQKGGVGKTTTTVNLAAGLAQLGQRVLVVDLDPQGNATMGSGVDKRKLEVSVYDVLIGGATIAQARSRSERGGYDLLGANRELAGAEIELVPLEHRTLRLKKALRVEREQYDFVLIDCPPSLSLLTLNGLCCAHGVIVPMQCEYYALEGLTDLVNTIKQVHANLNDDLELIGLLRVMFDPRMTLQSQVADQLKRHFGEKVYDSVVPRNVRLAEAPSYGLPGVVFDPSSRGAQAYTAFARELLQREGLIRAAAGAGDSGHPSAAAAVPASAPTAPGAVPPSEAASTAATASTAPAFAAPTPQPPAYEANRRVADERSELGGLGPLPGRSQGGPAPSGGSERSELGGLDHAA